MNPHGAIIQTELCSLCRFSSGNFQNNPTSEKKEGFSNLLPAAMFPILLCLSLSGWRASREGADPGRELISPPVLWCDKALRHRGTSRLRGPAAMLFISCNTCSGRLTKLVGASFCCGGAGVTQLSRDVLLNGVSHRCARVELRRYYVPRGCRTILGSC